MVMEANGGNKNQLTNDVENANESNMDPTGTILLSSVFGRLKDTAYLGDGCH